MYHWLTQLPRTLITRSILRLLPNWRGVLTIPPGHYYSPLIDIQNALGQWTAIEDAYRVRWQQVGASESSHLALYQELLASCQAAGAPTFRRYKKENVYFYLPDAFVLSGLLLKVQPKRVIEIGCGYSSAAMLDAIEAGSLETRITFVDPFPERLLSLLLPEDLSRHRLVTRSVQAVEKNAFDDLTAGDILFIDSSHILKLGSDLEYLLLDILPRLRPGVLLHFHDVFYPGPYPSDWIDMGRAWNEALAVLLLLRTGREYSIVFFNSYFAASCKEQLCGQHSAFLEGIPASIWLRKA